VAGCQQFEGTVISMNSESPDKSDVYFNTPAISLFSQNCFFIINFKCHSRPCKIALNNLDFTGALLSVPYSYLRAAYTLFHHTKQHNTGSYVIYGGSKVKDTGAALDLTSLRDRHSHRFIISECLTRGGSETIKD